MKYSKYIMVIGVMILTVALVGGTALSVYAKDGEDDPSSASAQSNEQENENEVESSDVNKESSDLHQRSERRDMEAVRLELKSAREKVAAKKDRLAGMRLQFCEKRQSVITAIMKRAGERGDKRIDFISTIANRVETFYQNKGKVLSAYDQLASDVAAKKAAAQAAVNAVKAADTQFNCGGENPKGMVAVFRAEIQAQAAALKEYRTSVKSLIVGVKSVQGSSSSDGAKE